MQNSRYGAHEVMELHEVMSATIDAINTMQLYMPYTKDAELRQILTNQLNFMTDEYNRLVHLINGRGAGMAIPYRPRTSGWPQAVSAPASGLNPNMDARQFDDRDVSSATLGLHKAGAKNRIIAALECADWEIRSTLLQGASNCANQAYDIWAYMHRHGYYPLLGMQEIANAQMLRGYQPMPTGQIPVNNTAPAMPSSGMASTNDPIYANSVNQTPVPPGSQTPYQAAIQPTSVSNLLSSHAPQESMQAAGNASAIFSSPAYREKVETDEAISQHAGEGADLLSPLHAAVEPTAQPTTRTQSRKKPSTN